VNVSIGRRLLFSSRQQDHPTDDRWFQNFKYLWLEFLLHGIMAGLITPREAKPEVAKPDRSGIQQRARDLIQVESDAWLFNSVRV
jgi:hypothetical protein